MERPCQVSSLVTLTFVSSALFFLVVRSENVAPVVAEPAGLDG